MNSQTDSKKPIFCKKLTSSFRYALRGIKETFISQRNMKIHSAMTVVMLFLSYYLKLNKIEFLFILLSSFLVLTTEIINSAIEKNIDIYTSKIDRNAMLGKDMAAGAVLMTVINAIIIGSIIFIPKIIDCYSKI